MGDLILCLDSGTTSVKAAVYDRSGQALARAEIGNTALERRGVQVEQDMTRTLADAERAIAACLAEVPEGVSALALTAQGDGLWPVAADGSPAGKAMTWLDGRAKGLLAAMPEALDRIEVLTAARTTAASQTLQLLWLQRNAPERFAPIRHALRLKEWLFLSLTGEMRAEPGSVLPAWGDWRSGAPLPEIANLLGLEKGVELLPPLGPVADCVAGLADGPAARLGLPAGLPVVLGPGDVQSSLVGLGVGPGLPLDRASVIGTSAIHGRYFDTADAVPRKLSGAMVQRFASGEGVICFHPSFNGGTTFRHMQDVLDAALPQPARPAYSALVLHPFFEPGGERAPVTHPQASAALYGMTAETTKAELAWAAREALAFLTRMSHADLGEGQEPVAVGGGVARDGVFMQLLASATGRRVQPHTGGDNALRGLAAIAMSALDGAAQGRARAEYLAPASAEIAPEQGPVRAYLEEKFALFERVLEQTATHWEGLARIGKAARTLNDNSAV